MTDTTTNSTEADSASAEDRRAGPPVDANEVVKACRVLAARFSKGVFQRVFDALDDELFELTGKIQDDKERNLFFEGLRLIRFEKERLGKTFHEKFSDYFNDSLRAGGHAASDDGADPESSLSLVNDNELEEELAVDNLVAKLRERYSEELYGIGQRFKALVRAASVEEDCVPLGPANFCHAFRDAVETLELDIKIKLYIYKLLDRVLTADIGEFYASVNNLLIDRGVLPDLKVKVKKHAPSRTPHGTATTASSQGQGQAQGPLPEAETGSTPIQEQMFQAMQHLLNAHFSESAPRAPDAGGDAPIQLTVTPMLLDTLSTLQRDDSLVARSEDLVRGGLKKHVVGSFSASDSQERPQSINQIDDETIDVISMIFDYILDDRSLPDFIKALIGRLQIPVLKVAIIDRTFFSDKTHPARQLLNELAHAGMGWNEESEAAKDRLYERMESVVMRILHEFESDVTIFETLLGEFRSFLEEEKEHFSVAQEKLSEQVQEAEYAERVKKAIAEEIAIKLLNRDVPEDIREFLISPWRKVITKITLEDGEDSDDRKKALQVVEDMVWSIAPKTSAEERKRLVVILPLMLDTLRDGLARIDYSDDETEEFIKVLEHYHFASMRGEPRGPAANSSEVEGSAREEGAPPGTVPAPGERQHEEHDDFDELMKGFEGDLDDLADLDLDNISGLDDLLDRKQGGDGGTFQRMMAEMGFELEEDPGPRIEDESTDLVRNLEVGTWLELTEDDDQKIRAKLAWKGDQYTNFSFVNRQYKVVAERPLYVLADQFRRGTATLIEDVALFDRAMDGVISGIVKIAKSP